MRYVFPDYEAYEPVLMQAGPKGIRMWAILKSKTLIAELDLFDSGVEDLPPNQATASFGQHHFSGALSLVPVTGIPGTVTLDVGAGGMKVSIQDGTIEKNRTLPHMDAGLQKPPLLLFDKTELPQVKGVSASLVWDAVKALKVDGVDAITVQLEKDKTVLAAWPNASVASVKDTASRPLVTGKTRVSHEMLDLAARFGNKEAPVQIDSLDIAFFDEGLLNLRYNFKHGAVKYWLTARVGD